MPSNQLKSIIQEIEQQNTDHFGKFYMYVSLLNTVAVRNKTFAEGIPKYDKGLALWRDRELKLGEISTQLTKQITAYSRTFANVEKPHWTKTAYNVTMAYLRQGKITDLIAIIDHMLIHLSAIQGKLSHNQNIYEYLNFADKKAGLTQFINQVALFNQQLLTIVDNSANTALSLLATGIGLVMVLSSVLTLSVSFLGLGLLIGGGYASYYFVTQLKEQTKQLEEQMSAITQKMNGLPKDSSLLGDTNHNSFFTAVLKPLPYAAITAAEQLTYTDEQQQTIDDARLTSDVFSQLFAV